MIHTDTHSDKQRKLKKKTIDVSQQIITVAESSTYFSDVPLVSSVRFSTKIPAATATEHLISAMFCSVCVCACAYLFISV